MHIISKTGLHGTLEDRFARLMRFYPMEIVAQHLALDLAMTVALLENFCEGVTVESIWVDATKEIVCHAQGVTTALETGTLQVPVPQELITMSQTPCHKQTASLVPRTSIQIQAQEPPSAHHALSTQA